MDSIRMPISGAASARPATSAERVSPPTQETATQTGADAVDINASVRAALLQSVSYQIIRRTFETDSDEAPPAPADPQAIEPEAPPRAEAPVEAVAEVVASQTTTAQTRVLEVESESNAPPVQKGDPLLLDLNGNGVETTGMAGAVRFDLDGDGNADVVSFASGGDAFLALDRNGNGRIDNGRELFGDQGGAANGFEALREFDHNADGRIDARDPVFDRLQLIRAGSGGALETMQLRDAGVTAIDLDYSHVQTRLNTYDSIAQEGTFERNDGGRGQVVDVLVGFRRG